MQSSFVANSNDQMQIIYASLRIAIVSSKRERGQPLSSKKGIANAAIWNA